MALLKVIDLGLIPYEECLGLQREYHKRLIAEEVDDLLITCSHQPVITCGSSTKADHLFVSAETLAQEGITLHKVERGGSITYHGPEQLVCYPLLNLTRHRRDVDWYMRRLEEVVISTLAEFGIEGIRVPGKTGVWLDEHSKIAFSGVRISRWCTYHGLSINVLPCAHRFRFINPCGLGEIRILSMADRMRTAPGISAVTMSIQREFCRIFGYETMVPENSGVSPFGV